MNLGYIGIGIMGRPMAHHLLNAGHSLFVHNRTREKCQSLEHAGATVCDSPAQVARHAQIIFLNVTDTPDVENVLFAPQGLASAARPGQIVVDNSTISPDATRKFAQRLKTQHDVDYIDAPVSGGDVGAQNATLSIMAGGEPRVFQKVKPLLQTLGRTVTHVGPIGTGQICKACNQLFCALHMLAVAEGINLAQRAGLDPATMVQVVSKGASASWALDNLAPKVLDQDWAPGFMIDLLAKDLGYVTELARSTQTPLPGLALAQQLLQAAQAQNHGRQGTQALAQTLQSLTTPQRQI